MLRYFMYFFFIFFFDLELHSNARICDFYFRADRMEDQRQRQMNMYTVLVYSYAFENKCTKML